MGGDRVRRQGYRGVGRRGLRRHRPRISWRGAAKPKGRVLVPTYVYKAIYVPARKAAAAYFAPNDDSQNWDTLSIAELETRVGIDVFPPLDVKVREHAMILPTPTPHFGCRLQTSEASQKRSAQGRE